MSKFYNNLFKEVLDNSKSKIWEVAVKEWEITDVKEDNSLSQSCICGHPELKYLFTITNTTNGKSLFPIGSECIKKFNRDDLYEEASLKEQLFHLYHTIQNNKFIELKSGRLLYYLYQIGAFPNTQYNKKDGYNDYLFLLEMFNKRSTISIKQDKKVKAIILGSIKPFVMNQLKIKIK